jgi:hypothetical protein
VLTVDLAARATRRRTATLSVSRCGSWHASTCPCHGAGRGSTAGPGPGPDHVADTVREPGRPLDEPVRRRMQERLGHDFGAVRVHADQRAGGGARGLGALAYTLGEHVVLDSERLPSAPSERDAVLAHELVHTVQQGPLAGHRRPDRISDPGDAHEREAHRIAGSSDRFAAPVPAPAGAVQRAPAPEVENPAGISLTIRTDGRLDVVLRGPKAPVVGKPAAGLRRNVDGTYTAVFGADEKVVAPSEIPPMLRGMVGAAAKGEVAPRSFRIPSCSSLRSADETRWMTFDEYRVTQMLSPGLMPLTPLFYEKLTASCSPEPAPASPAPVAPQTGLPPAPQPGLPPAPHEPRPPLVRDGEALA